MNMTVRIILSCILAYLLGSLSGGIITSRIGHGPEYRGQQRTADHGLEIRPDHILF